MKRYLTTAIAAGFALTSFSLLAQFEETPPTEETAETPAFESVDADGDGHVSRQEANSLPCLSENYDYVETESDMGLSRNEFDQAVQSYCAGW